MQSKFVLTALASALTLACSAAQAAEIYPVDKTRFMTNWLVF